MGDIDGAKEQETVKISKATISVSKIAENVNALAGWSFVVDTQVMEDAPAEIISKDLRRQPHPSMPPPPTSSYKVPDILSFINSFYDPIGKPQDPNTINRTHCRVVYIGFFDV